MADSGEPQDRVPVPALRYPSSIDAYNLVATIKSSRNDVVVYKAEFTAEGGENKTVAIKAIPLSSQSVTAMNAVVRGAELSLTARPHPNLVLARHFFLDPATPSRLCAVLPFFRKGSVAYISGIYFKYGFYEEAVSAILKEVLKALVHLHRLGIPHRDIKPGNIFIGGEKEKHFVALADLGLSTEFISGVVDDDDDAPYWLAPEAFRAPEEAYTTKSDIWAFGVTALELSHGRAPLSRRVPTSPPMRMKIRDRFECWDYEANVHNLFWVFSKPYQDMVDACLKRDPSERLTADELLALPFFSVNVRPNIRSDSSHLTWVMEHAKIDVDRKHPKRPPRVESWLLGTETKVHRRIAGWELNKERCYLEAIFAEDPRPVGLGRDVDRLVEGLARVGAKMEDEEDKAAVMEAVRGMTAAEMGRAAVVEYAQMMANKAAKGFEETPAAMEILNRR